MRYPPLIQSHTTTVSNGDKILYSVTNTFSISRSGAESHDPAASHYPVDAAKAAVPYQSLISRTLDMSAENVLQPPGGGPEVQTIIHRFNCLHLLVAKEEIRETLVCGKRRRVRISTQWTYDCDDARVLADQPARYALPREKRITWDENGPAPRYLPHYRCDVSRYEYDIAGNFIRHVWPDGNSENIDYYSPAGEEHCPAEPQGFIRFIKKITYCQAGAPTPGRTLMYRYRGFPGRTDSPLAGRPMILCVALEVPRQLLQRFDYYLAPDGAHNENGRLIKNLHPLSGGAPQHLYRNLPLAQNHTRRLHRGRCAVTAGNAVASFG
ncbi:MULTISPECIES: hypothetical protein [Enterobacterales]|uniref:Uncharacterized protein n=1 Tax=Candidatus Sodalis endolongispinus TaxID=2812662 RepID=A0ABS5YCB2_9GAMM|nr:MULTISPECIES: hypothetical protein [Enterobacterales]MBT9432607.1 hypothetical protein [Candidatus Sodalis endolongispinus]